MKYHFSFFFAATATATTTATTATTMLFLAELFDLLLNLQNSLNILS